MILIINFNLLLYLKNMIFFWKIRYNRTDNKLYRTNEFCFPNIFYPIFLRKRRLRKVK